MEHEPRIHSIYEIECLLTGQKYIGMTTKNPCLRWSEHYIELRNGISHSVLLQSAWQKASSMIHWRFRVVEEAFGRIAAKHQEAALILAIPQELRLNTNKTSTLSLQRRMQVQEMLKQGHKYVDISTVVGISMGTISKIRHGRL